MQPEIGEVLKLEDYSESDLTVRHVISEWGIFRSYQNRKYSQLLHLSDTPLRRVPLILEQSFIRSKNFLPPLHFARSPNSYS